MIVSIYIENERLDLFDDESISIVSSVLDVQDININTTEYSRPFTVPASDNNNNIFKHYYNSDIDNGFDARKKAIARIEIGGVVFREGKITLTKVIIKSGRPSSYMINFFGLLVSLKVILGSDKLSVLDCSEFTEAYTPDFVKALLTNNQTPDEIILSIPHRDDLICSLLSNRKYFYASNSTAYDATVEANLYYSALLTSNGAKWNELKPSFKIRSIIEKIETKYGINFTGGFFDTTLFDNLYLCLDNGSSLRVATVSEDVAIDWTAGLYDYIYTSWVNIPILSPETYSITCSIDPVIAYLAVPYTLKMYVNDVLIEQISPTGNSTLTTNIFEIGDYTIYFVIETQGYFEYTPTITVAKSGFSETATLAIPSVLNVDYNVAEQMPGITILDFLKGLIQAFKLVIVPTSATDIYINSVETYYSEGNIIDITKYVDISQIEINRPTLLNKISYSFQDPATILNKQFKGSTSEAYGDEKLFIYDDAGALIDGGSIDIQLPFEQVIYERLIDTQTNTNTPIQYGALIDDKLASVNIKPHVHYAILRDIATIGFNNGSGIENLTGEYFAPSHVAADLAFGTGFIFGSEIEEFSKLTITDNLYTEYYSTYINNLFNIKRRSYTVSTKNIPINIISEIKLNDTIVIGISYFRIDSMDINITSGEIKFNLFNI